MGGGSATCDRDAEQLAMATGDVDRFDRWGPAYDRLKIAIRVERCERVSLAWFKPAMVFAGFSVTQSF